MFNNIIGSKPTRGLISTRGVVPTCRTLDCSSIFAKTFSDAAIVLSVVRDFDEFDPYLHLPSISSVVSPWIIASTFRFGIETVDTREFFGDVENPLLFEKSISVIKENLGGEPVELEITYFIDVANLLYKDPWVPEGLLQLA